MIEQNKTKLQLKCDKEGLGGRLLRSLGNSCAPTYLPISSVTRLSIMAGEKNLIDMGKGENL